MNLKEQAFIQAILAYEDIGFMEWHARVLRELSPTPQNLKSIARKTGLFMYQVHSVSLDLLGLGLIEYTRHGLQLVDDWSMLSQLVECCESEKIKSYDYEAAFDVVNPQNVALKKKFGLNE